MLRKGEGEGGRGKGEGAAFLFSQLAPMKMWRGWGKHVGESLEMAGRGGKHV